MAYKAHQLPSLIEENIIEWELNDFECNIQLSNKGEITGQWVKWDEEKEDWVESPMSTEEIKEIVKEADLKLPVKKGVKSLIDML